MKHRARPPTAHATPSKRKGAALFITVMCTSLIVSVIGLVGLQVLTVKRQRVQTAIDISVARGNAYSAVEIALRKMADDPNWRTTYSNGVESARLSPGPSGTGTVSWVLEDSDGQLDDADTELRLKGVGRFGDVVQVFSVKLVAVDDPLTCLQVAACSDGETDLQTNSTLATNQTLHTNASIQSAGTVNSDVDAVGGIQGSGYNGTNTTPVQSRTVPAVSALDYYVTNGTTILFSDLQKGPQQSRQINRVVLSPAINPFGSGQTNAQGIYVIDCGGGKVWIQMARIVGTLVLLNAGEGSKIFNSVHMQSAVAGYPTLLVQGSIEFNYTQTALSESRIGRNFNPPGTPYQGVEDSDQDDSYPSTIEGLLYVSADVVVQGDPTVTGVLVAGRMIDLRTSSSLTVNYDSRYLANPPPGFSNASSSVKRISGTWRREAAP